MFHCALNLQKCAEGVSWQSLFQTLQLVPTHVALGQPFLVAQAPSHGTTSIIKEVKYFSIRLIETDNQLCIGLQQAHAEA